MEALKAEEFLPSWWDRHCSLQHTYGTCSLAVRLKALGMRKADVASWLLALKGFIVRNVDPRVELALELDASENELSDEAGVCLVSGLQSICHTREGPFRLRVLKLHKNKVGDDTCVQLASLVWHQVKAVEEIHLSHNEVQQKGATALLAALAMHPEKAYPRETPCEDVPCWVRLEHNQVSHVEYILELLGQEPAKLRFCMAPRREKGASCTSFRCQESRNVAHVHLYCIDKQESEPETRKHAEAVVKSVLHLQGAGPSAGPAARAVAEAEELAWPDAAACRFEDLKVDPALGAGLELTADPYGFLIETVDETPGQRLNANEVILEIDGVQLWGDLDEERLGDAFGSRFADGARIRVARADAVRGRPLWQPLTIPGPSLASRCEALSSSLNEDFKMMGHHGVKVELQENGVWLRGPPRSQRWAVDELPKLIPFYFPEASLPFPSCHWRGDAEDLCMAKPYVEEAADGVDGAEGVERFAELVGWEKSLRGQWREDDDLFDEDLPVEPLEAPDDGPEVFEGEALLPEVQVLQPLKVLVLVGLPGSGKSTLAARLQKFGWVVINQDTLGDRKKCVAAANDALSSGKRIVVDRCNVTRLQRRVWLGVADDNKASTACIWLDVPEEECGDRVLHRFGHSTLPAQNSSLEVISAFQERFESPMEAEGFVMWYVRDDGDLDEAVVQLQELVERSEALPQEPTRREVKSYAPRAAFPYKAFAQAFQHRGARALYLRTLRRQIEYYFSDKNLKQDWFFQEKIQEPPENGWLELRWLLSCPRIRDIHCATAEDVLEALGPSPLKKKAAHGTHWVRRTKPLPKLKEKRPPKGQEPAWYVMLHAEADQNDSGAESVEEKANGDHGESSEKNEGPKCAVCRRHRPENCFSKAQLTKHRRSPTCKTCVAP